MAIRKPIFVIPKTLGTVVCGNARGGNPVFNLGEFNAIGLTWRTLGNGDVWARGQFEESASINFCAMMAANALAGTTIRLRLGTTQAEVDGAGIYDSGALPFISPSIVRDDGIYHSHLEMPSPITALWWRIDIGGHAGDFEASSLVLGKQIIPSRYYNMDYERGIEDLGEINFGRWGVPDEIPGAIMRTLGFTLAWQTEAEFEANFRPMMETLGKRGAVYVCFDPDPTAYRQSKTYMGVTRKPPFARGLPKPLTVTQEFELLSPY